MSWIRLWKRTFASLLPFLYVELRGLGGGDCVLLQSLLTVPEDKTTWNDRSGMYGINVPT